MGAGEADTLPLRVHVSLPLSAVDLPVAAGFHPLRGERGGLVFRALVRARALGRQAPLPGYGPPSLHGQRGFALPLDAGRLFRDARGPGGAGLDARGPETKELSTAVRRAPALRAPRARHEDDPVRGVQDRSLPVPPAVARPPAAIDRRLLADGDPLDLHGSFGSLHHLWRAHRMARRRAPSLPPA